MLSYIVGLMIVLVPFAGILFILGKRQDKQKRLARLEELKEEYNKAYDDYCAATKACFPNEADFYRNKYLTVELGVEFKMAYKTFDAARKAFLAAEAAEKARK